MGAVGFWLLGMRFRWTMLAVIFLPQVAAAVFLIRRQQRMAAGKPSSQFGMRDLVIGLTLLGVWLGLAVEDRRRVAVWYDHRRGIEDAAMCIIGQGRVRFSGNEDRLAIVVARKSFNDDDLNALLDGIESEMARGGVYHLSLSGAMITDKGVRRLTRCDELEMLSLDGTQITDAGLSALLQHPRLRLVSAAGTRATQGILDRLNK